jgi:hypothetical protein
MIAAAARTVGMTALVAVALVLLFARGSTTHRVLDPSDPIAADGSLIAGRAHTIFDTEPALGAFREPRPNSDDPADFEPLIRIDMKAAESERALFKRLLGRLDWSLCTGSDRRWLLLAVRTYYATRGREKYIFSLRGPRTKAAIESEWSTPADRDIDDYVRHALQYGILHKSDVPRDSYAEFAKVFADTEALGTGCTAADNR